jgi:PmbA protein
MDILTRLASQVDQAEVIEVQTESAMVGFEGNKLKSSQVQETRGVALRVVKGGRLGFAASSDESALEKLVVNALESATYGDQICIAFPAQQPAPRVAAFDPTIASLPIPRLVEIGQEMIGVILQMEPAACVNVSLERGVQHVRLRNQTGTDVSFKRSPLSISFDVTRVRGDDIVEMLDIMGATLWEDDYLAFARDMGSRFELARVNATIRTRRMPVLFSPKGMLTLALPLAVGFDGQNVFRGVSPMKGRIGEKLFDDMITIADDATIDGKLGSAPYDDEGVAHRRTVLVDHGVLKGFLYDLKTAAQSGVESTGNGSRGLLSPPSPAPTNLIFEAGHTPLAEIIGDIREGLLVEEALGLGQGNIISGAFSNPLSLAFKIEKGEIVGRAKGVSIAGNVYDLLQDVAAVSRETQWVYGNCNLPYILLADMNVVAKE